jgi:SprT protein
MQKGMSKTEHPLQALADFLPAGTFLPVAEYLQHYKVHLTVARERKSILGDYRNAHSNHNHRISVNGNLNTWSFLVTLLHELAHLLTFEKYGNKMQSHGREWKTLFGQLLAQFIKSNVFPADIEKELLATLHNPGASSCAEENLMRVLRRYDSKKEGQMLVEEIPPQGLFKMKDGRIFKKGERLRKRYRCEEVGTKKVYLFSPVFEVEWAPNP